MASSVGKVLTAKKFSQIGIGSISTVALNAYGAVADYKQSRLEGRSKLSSGIVAAGNSVMFDAIGLPGMLALGGLKYGPQAITSGIIKANAIARSMDRSARNTPFANSTFVDTQQAYTMRQAGMQMAQASKYNLQQSLLGNEATSMHKL